MLGFIKAGRRHHAMAGQRARRDKTPGNALPGISAVLGYLYKSLIDAAASREIAQEVATIIRNALNNAPVDGVLNRSLSELGIAGADQVAELVKQVASQHQ